MQSLLVAISCASAVAQGGTGTNSSTAANPSAGMPATSNEASPQARRATDDVNKVEASVADANRLVGEADKYQKTIAAITLSSPKNSSPIDNLQQLLTTVEAISKTTLIGSLNDSKKALDGSSSGSLESTRNQECSTLSQNAGAQPQDVSDVLTRCSNAASHASAELATVSSALSNLQEKLQTVSPYFGAQIAALQNQLKPFSDPRLAASSPDPSAILEVLVTALPNLRFVLQNQDPYQTAWSATKKALGDLSITAGAKDASGAAAVDPDNAVKDLQSAIDGITPKLDGWFKALAGEMQSAAQTLDNMISGILGDPGKNSAAALAEVRKRSDEIASAQALAEAWQGLAGLLSDGQPADFHLKPTSADENDLEKWTNVARSAVSRVHDALAGDFSNFETDQVSLYYFTDVARLMYVLNEGYITVGGVADAKAKADAQRTALTQTELDLADAQATVNRYQKQVGDLQEQQRQAQVGLKGLNTNLSKLANKLNSAQDAKNQADANYKQTQDNQANAPNDPTQKIAVDRAAAQQTQSATKLSQSQSDYDAAKSDQQKAQSQLDDTQNQKDSLPAKLAAAQQALSDAQTAVAAERRKMLLAAQAESDAYAFARDNTPFMYAMADASSQNPVKRVMLYAFNDNKTIFMRGKRTDLDEVKRIIAAFDQPAPQARLTLWTFQLSAEAGQKANKASADKLNKSMAIIDEELSDTRALQNTTLTLLRDLINEKVRSVATLPTPLPACPVSVCTEADWLKLGRLNFYDPLVLKQLNFERNMVAGKELEVKRLRGEIPDPAGTTTLGEALLVLSLAPPDTRKEIRKKFESQILDRLKALPISDKIKEQIRLSELAACPVDPVTDQECFLPLTWHALGIWERDPVAGFTSEQLEITRALKTAYDQESLRQIITKMNDWLGDLSSLTSQIDAARHQLAIWHDKAAQGNPLPAALQDDSKKADWVMPKLSPLDAEAYSQQFSQLTDLLARQGTIEQESVGVVNELRRRGFDVGDTLSKAAAEKVTALATPILSAATPREAAADEMLKQMIIAIEDDLDRLFMQPMIVGLRKRLMADAKANVGILQRESMLATNRGKARVDARASAQLAVGEEEDILQGVQQLAQIYGKIQAGGALGALGALEALPREPAPEIDALTTGSNFDVTPIFDPSGQALRFKFDYVGTTNLQEPNGTTNPQLPKIERHTVNTEVQLSNLETREISRFESDSRLGIPTQYWGGIPILKDIPYVRPWVPLIGWFVRKAGSNAVAQQSVIFGQTTIYPSIQMMVSLLEDSESNPGLNELPPKDATPQTQPGTQPGQPPSAPPQGPHK